MTDKGTVTLQKRVHLGHVHFLDLNFANINQSVDRAFAALQRSLPEGVTAQHTFHGCNHEVHIRWEKPESFIQDIILRAQINLAVSSAFKGFRYSADTFEVGVNAETIAAEAASQAR